MTQVIKTVLIHHSASCMFMLVDDVEKYPEFLPWCGGVDLIQKDEQTTTASLHIDYRGVHQKFTTENHKIFPHFMEIKLKQGPFKHLEGVWRFIPLNEDACKIEFELNYAFSNQILDKVIAPVFNHIASTFVDGFVKRADEIYKK